MKQTLELPGKGFFFETNIGTTGKGFLFETNIGTTGKGFLFETNIGTTGKGFLFETNIGTTGKGFLFETNIGTTWKGFLFEINIGTTGKGFLFANVSDILFSLLFADDTSVFIQGDQLDDIADKMNIELKKLVAWLNANKLSLNIDKTQYMIFRTSNRKLIIPTKLEINDNAIKQVSSTTFLGITIDNKLNWAEHINKVKCNISKGVGIINKACLCINTTVVFYQQFLVICLNLIKMFIVTIQDNLHKYTYPWQL